MRVLTVSEKSEAALVASQPIAADPLLRTVRSRWCSLIRGGSMPSCGGAGPAPPAASSAAPLGGAAASATPPAAFASRAAAHARVADVWSSRKERRISDAPEWHSSSPSPPTLAHRWCCTFQRTPRSRKETPLASRTRAGPSATARVRRSGGMCRLLRSMSLSSYASDSPSAQRETGGTSTVGRYEERYESSASRARLSSSARASGSTSARSPSEQIACTAPLSSRCRAATPCASACCPSFCSCTHWTAPPSRPPSPSPPLPGCPPSPPP
mmetsp:Transcript_11389/g.37278  ORF Transcript_11389/g.37278 Transcript_11389/m.37278 type:complete len:270 (+) Transcript_11389:182-991(+)